MIAASSGRAALILFLIWLAPLSAGAETAPQLCEALAAQAGAEAGLPEGLLPAIARAESGKPTAAGVRAWPWTLNQGGDGSYHATKAEALAHLEALLARGVRNVDLGCMQLNWRWHGTAFADAATMMDPVANTRYAAAFLRELHARHGSWTQAVAHYHSADPQRGTAYAARVSRLLGHITPPGPEMMAALDSGAVVATCATGETPYAANGPGAGRGCHRSRGLLLIASGGLLGRAAGRDLRQPPLAATGPAPRYLR